MHLSTVLCVCVCVVQEEIKQRLEEGGYSNTKYEHTLLA